VTGIFKEFRDFVTRGNIVELAVAVVIGLAFVAVINAVVEGIITPVVGLIGNTEVGDIDFTVRDSTFEIGLVINAVIQFLIIAAAVFLVIVKPINILNQRRKRGEEEPAELSDEAELLTEIRDLLRTGNGSAGPRTGI
jgi:large conductance mechanosensitive channel